MTPVVLSWSGGKDSALALHALQQQSKYNVCGLLTSVNQHYQRISMHGVREPLLDTQAEAIGLPLYKVRLSERPSNAEYEQKMRAVLDEIKSHGIRHIAFGDLFLEDIRDYRMTQLRQVDMQAVFPLWHRPTDQLADEFVALGFKAVLCCVDGQALPADYAGREFDAALLNDLPAGTDPCGENGELHSFVYAGPVFRRPVPVRTGKRVTRDQRFHFCDLLALEN